MSKEKKQLRKVEVNFISKSGFGTVSDVYKVVVGPGSTTEQEIDWRTAHMEPDEWTREIGSDELIKEV